MIQWKDSIKEAVEEAAKLSRFVLMDFYNPE